MLLTKNKHFATSAGVAILLLLSKAAFAVEPLNLSLAKQAAIKYHNSGEYEKDVTSVIDKAHLYLQSRLKTSFHGEKPAIILDIDETALSNYPFMVKAEFASKEAESYMMQGKDPAIIPTLKLSRFAKAHHIAIVFISGRDLKKKMATINNLKKAGYTWDKLILRGAKYMNKPATDYKVAMRKQLVRQGYVILANIGDQISDLSGGYAEKTFKLPNPFYYIP